VPFRDRRLTGDRKPPRPDDPLTGLVGIGPRSAEALAAEGVRTVLELLLHVPRRYEDRSRLTRLDGRLEPGSWVLVLGRVSGLRVRRVRQRSLHIVDGVIDDGRGTLEVVWFNQRWVHRRLRDEPELYLYGQIREAKGGRLQLVNPEIEEAGEDAERIVPVYPRLGRFGGKRLRRLIAQCLPAAAACADPLSEALRLRYSLPILGDALRDIHAPPTSGRRIDRDRLVAELNSGRNSSQRRLAFDELLAFACAMTWRRRSRRRAEAPPVTTGFRDLLARHGSLLSFELTAAQQRVLSEIAADLGCGFPMARLVQGDVGSGKTVVAEMAMLMVLEAGYQVAFMAPTELLAEQHTRTLSILLMKAGYQPQQLTSSLPLPQQRAVRDGLAAGSVDCVVGTHALFQQSVSYRNLGLVVVDEQHRFGVAQRQALVGKGRSPHLLVMTATPIPRSLALTVYGDLDLSIVDELPPGRTPVSTYIRLSDARGRVFKFLRTEIADGGRAFVVYPIIDVSEEVQAAALTDHEIDVRRRLPGVEVGVLHGRLDRARREAVVSGFRDGSIQVLLATTVVEVGVDVPEASVMVIESAERFGLSQLHQLRGRVGRGRRKSRCILMTEANIGEDARRRLEVLCASNDGFEIAEADLELRGPGELTGTRQWGPAGFRFANLARDGPLIAATRDLARNLDAENELDAMRDSLAVFHSIEVAGRGG
jgi:ATP-dependent DNA helicase RecG